MNAHGKAGLAAGIVGAVTALLLTPAAAADEVMIVYGKRMVKAEVSEFAQPAMDTAGILVALHDELRVSIREDIRTSLRDGFDALRMEIAKDQGEATDFEVALLATRAGV